MWRDVDRQRQAAALLLELDRAVHKSPLLLNAIQDSLDLHPAVRSEVLVRVGTTILSESTRDASSIAAPASAWKLPDLRTPRTRPQVFAKPQTVSHSSHTPHQVSLSDETQRPEPLSLLGQRPTDSA